MLFTPIVAASLFFAQPVPLDMPAAEAYQIKTAKGERILEDRFFSQDLWFADALLGRWLDEDGRIFCVYSLDKVPPKFSSSSMKRAEWLKDVVPMPEDADDLALEAVALLVPDELLDEGVPLRQKPRLFDSVLFHDTTNSQTIAMSFLREETRKRYLAVWELAPGDDPDYAKERLVRDFLGKWDEILPEYLRSELPEAKSDSKRKKKKSGLEAEIMAIMNKSLKTALDLALEEIFKEWK